MISSNHRQHYFHTTPFLGATNTSEMKDEYGTMDDSGASFVVQDFVLENGVTLPKAELRYQTYGTLNESKTNVLLICHALTGNASLHSWWGGLLGPHLTFDTSKYFVVCCNILGSCYGSTGPRSINPSTGLEYSMDFPDVSVKDTVKLQLTLLQEKLGIHSVKAVIGGSFGGMQSMEAAVQGGSCDADFVTMEDGKWEMLNNSSYRNTPVHDWTVRYLFYLALTNPTFLIKAVRHPLSSPSFLLPVEQLTRPGKLPFPKSNVRAFMQTPCGKVVAILRPPKDWQLQGKWAW
jgi:hypothetical protein